ncbi:phosphate butyryltransferase [Neobacillus sp. SM06]|uniref:phosphate butyryltransferase n=1 Tax=Neobacillus sp. SM06 TaxID=3422492 RepID=UPI003D2DB18C
MLLNELVDRAARYPLKTVAVAAAEDEEVIDAIANAISSNLAKFLLFGNKERIVQLLKEKNPNLLADGKVILIDVPSKETAAESAVKAVSGGEADVLMKGNLSTPLLLKAVLNKEYDLRTGRILSHTAVFEVPGFERFVLITDSAINIAPNLEQKGQIIENAVAIAKSIGIELPKVAPIAAVETINPAMPATVDAAALTLMNRRGQLNGCMVDGPLALDNAISSFAAEHKGIQSEVAGRADILLVPTLEVGNALYKSLVYFAKAKVGGVVSGSKVPIVVTSRSDTAENKLCSLALALSSVQK